MAARRSSRRRTVEMATADTGDLNDVDCPKLASSINTTPALSRDGSSDSLKLNKRQKPVRDKDFQGQTKQDSVSVVEKALPHTHVRKRKSAGNDCPAMDQKRPKEKHDMGVSAELGNASKSVRAQSKKQSNKQETNSKESVPLKASKPMPKSVKLEDKSANNGEKNMDSMSDRTVNPESVSTRPDSMTNSFSVHTEDSSSSDLDSDFEEVSSQYRTPESSWLSSVNSDSGLCYKEESFSDNISSQITLVTPASCDSTELNSPSCSTQNTSSQDIISCKATKKASSKSAKTKKAPTTNKDEVIPKKESVPESSKQGSITNKDLALQKKGNHESSKKPVKTNKNETLQFKKENVENSKKAVTTNINKALDREERVESSKRTKLNEPRKKRDKNSGGSAGKKETPAAADETDIMSLLMQMEGKPTKPVQVETKERPSSSSQSAIKKRTVVKKKHDSKNMTKADSSEESDWEEVEDYKHSPVKSQIPDGPVEITIDDPGMLHRKRKKKEFDWKAYVQRKIKRLAKEIQVDMHKVHLLCLLSGGMLQNSVCGDPTLCAAALSIIPHAQLKTAVAFHDDQTIVFLVKWFRSEFSLDPTTADRTDSLVTASQLMKVIQDRTAREPRLLVMVLAAVLRAMGFNVRLVISLQPLPLKTSSIAIAKEATKRKKADNPETVSTSSKSKKTKHASDKHKSTKVVANKLKTAKTTNKQTNIDPHTSHSASKNNTLKSITKHEGSRKPSKDIKHSNDVDSSNNKDLSDSDANVPSVTKRQATERATKPEKNRKPTKNIKRSNDAKSLSDDDLSNDDASGPSTTKRRATERVRKPGKTRKPTKKMKRSNDAQSSSDQDLSDDDASGPSLTKRRVSRRATKPMKLTAPGNNKDCGEHDESVDERGDSDGSNFSEEEEEVARKGKGRSKGKGKKMKMTGGKTNSDEGSDAEFDKSFSPKSLLVQKGKTHSNRKILSGDSGSEEMVESNGRDYWLEVYLPRPSKWFCVDCIKCKVGKPFITSAAASQPLLYVLGFENDGSVKDITAKYAPQWLSHTRKQRVDCDWWRDSLQTFASLNTTRDAREDKDIKDHLVNRPLPTSIGEFKNHPLYALRRHLLKYEAIYPETSIPVGYIRHEPVFARDCVHTLHSRDNWLREARLVRIGETAYKMVKSRKRWNRARDNPEELDLELFGRWQTEDFIPLPAVNGKVPKNEYGNVELFQPSMLPGGTVHIRVPALNRVAKKLGIDIAAAMTGWDHHCGYSHPVLDGWVVCEEHREVLLAAWEEDQEIQRHREEERREKRVLNNWTTLVRGLMIKERLKNKFNLEEKTVEVKPKKEAKTKKGKKATDVQHAWPARQQQKAETQTQKPAPSHFTVETM